MACSRLAIERGIDLTLLTRGQHATGLPAGARSLTCRHGGCGRCGGVLGTQSFDVVVDWIAFTPAHIERDLNSFADGPAVHLYQLGERLSKTCDSLPDYRVDAFSQPALGLFAQ